MKPRHLIPALLLVLPVAYLLSIGPLMLLNTRYNHGNEPSWGWMYTPVFWMCDQSPLFTRTMEWYLDRWMPAAKQ